MIGMSGDHIALWMLMTIKESKCVTNSVSLEPLLAFGPCYPSVAPWSELSRSA